MVLTHYSEIARVAVLAQAGARAHHAVLHRLRQRHHLARQPLLDIVQSDISQEAFIYFVTFFNRIYPAPVSDFSFLSYDI